MKFIISLFILMVISTNLNAQKVVQKAPKQFVADKNVTATKAKGKYPRLTDSTYTVTDGTVFPIYESVNHKYFIIRVSKKSGSEYNQYLKIN